MMTNNFSDFTVAFIFIEETVPYGLFQREGFLHSRKLLLIFWLVMGNFILVGYKGTLLSNLVKIEYESTINSYDDLDKSGLKYLFYDCGYCADFINAHTQLNVMINKILWHAPRDLGSDWYEER